MRTPLPCFKRLSSIRLFPLLLVVFALGACDSKAPVIEKAKAVAKLAKLVKVGVTNEKEFLNYPAVIAAQESTTLSFNVGGMITELPIVEAQQVKKGDLLAKLDQRDLIAQLDSAKAQFNNDNTAYQRAVNLMKEDAISQSVLDQRKAQQEVSKAQLETAEKALEDSVIVAPFDGAIAKVSIKLREVVQAGSAAIDLLGNGGLKAIINIPSSIIANSRGEEPATDSYVVLDAAPNRKIPAVFKEISLEADAASQTYEATFTFDSPENIVILPGMNAVVWFRDPSQKSSQNISIPLTAIATNGEQKYVWVVDSSTMNVTKRNIVIEQNIGTSVSVLSGLTVGETIVSTGITALAEGMEVAPWSK